MFRCEGKLTHAEKTLGGGLTSAHEMRIICYIETDEREEYPEEVVFREPQKVGLRRRTFRGMDLRGRGERRGQVASDGVRTRYQGGAYGAVRAVSGRLSASTWVVPQDESLVPNLGQGFFILREPKGSEAMNGLSRRWRAPAQAGMQPKTVRLNLRDKEILP